MIMKKTRSRKHFLSRSLLWAHVIGVVGFYLVLWQRTAPNKKDCVKPLPTEDGVVSSSRSAAPTVSIIVPARNEESNIGRCVTSLLEQDYEHYEIIVVDDGSTDATGRILDELTRTHPNRDRLWVLRLRDLPTGWAGKPHALHCGVQEARGEWLLFTDADTWHAPHCLRSAMAQALQEKADLFTMGAEQELPSFWDKVLMPMAYLSISMQYPPKKVNDPNSSVAIANGQYILIRRQVYDIIGGYARPDLRSTLLDDRDLARVVKGNGFRLCFMDGRNLLRVHMYHGLRDTWRGWRKNAYLGSRGGLPFVVLSLIGLPMISIVPFLLPLLALFSGTKKSGISQTEIQLAATAELVPLLAYRTWLNKELEVPWRYTLTHPLAGAIFEGILCQSAWRVLTHKGVDWRGRRYYEGQGSSEGIGLEANQDSMKSAPK